MKVCGSPANGITRSKFRISGYLVIFSGIFLLERDGEKGDGAGVRLGLVVGLIRFAEAAMVRISWSSYFGVNFIVSFVGPRPSGVGRGRTRA